MLFLWLAARGLIKGIRRWFPHRWPYLCARGWHLYRPANQTVTVVWRWFRRVALATLFLVQHTLLRQFRPGGEGGRPNLMFFDIQPGQTAASRRPGLERAHRHPLVPIVPC